MRLSKYFLLFVVSAIPVFCQALTVVQSQFEVASIKRNTSGSRRVDFGGGPGRFAAQNVTLGMLINRAYNVQGFQVSGGPSWLNSDRYDIQATPPESVRSRQDLWGPLLQNLLQDRFKLSVRREIQERPIYILTVAKDRSKLKSGNCISQEPNGPLWRPEVCGFTVMDSNMIRATQIDMSRFISMLTPWVMRTIVDKTGFAGTFDVDLKWNPNETAVANVGGAASTDVAPSIFTTLEEQLDLKLESDRGPVEVLVIDRAERPTEN